MNLLIPTMILLAAQTAVAPEYYSLTVEQQAAGTDGAMRHYRVAADLNGDGKADKAELQLRCDGGLPTDAVLTPAAVPAGKRQHKPMTITKEWGAASPQLTQAKVGYNVKKVEGTGARTAGIPVNLIGAGPLCALATIGR